MHKAFQYVTANLEDVVTRERVKIFTKDVGTTQLTRLRCWGCDMTGNWDEFEIYIKWVSTESQGTQYNNNLLQMHIQTLPILTSNVSVSPAQNFYTAADAGCCGSVGLGGV